MAECYYKIKKTRNNANKITDGFKNKKGLFKIRMCVCVCVCVCVCTATRVPERCCFPLNKENCKSSISENAKVMYKEKPILIVITNNIHLQI